MANDAQATFTATLDSSGIQSGARSALSALEKLGQQIQRRSKDLAAMKAAQVRLVQSAGVQEYLKRQKAIEKNEAFEKKTTERAIAAIAKRDAAAAQGVGGEGLAKLTIEAEKAQQVLAGVKSELQALQEAQSKLTASDAGVAAFRDQAKVIKATESELAELQTQYSATGGSATDLASEIKEPTSGIMKLAEEAKKAGGPIGTMGGILEQVGALKMAGPLALIAILIALAAAAIKAGIALAKFVMISADAARNAARARLNAAFGASEGAKAIEGTMKALRDQTALSKSEAQGLAAELYRAGERGKNLEDAALTIARFGQLGEDAAGSVKSLYDELRKPTAAIGIAGGVAKSMAITADMLPRDVFLALAAQLGKDGTKALVQGFTANKDDIRTALSQIGETKFGGTALEQMRSLDKLSERLQENISSLFAGVKVGVLLGALQKLVGLLDETSESGKAIRDSLAAIAQPLGDAVEAALPYLEVFLEGLVYTALVVVLMGLKIKNALSGLIPDSLTKNIDWLEVAFWSGAAAMGIFAAALFTVAAVLLILASPFLVIVAVIALLVYALVTAADYIIGWADDVSAAFDEIDFSAIGSTIVDSIVNGLTEGAAALYAKMANLGTGAYDAFKAAIKSKSPSVLFRMAGRTIPQGVGLGVEDESDQVENAVSKMANPADMVAPNGGGKRGNGGGGPNINIAAGAIVINGANAESIEEQLERALNNILKRAALSGGLSPEPEAA